MKKIALFFSLLAVMCFPQNNPQWIIYNTSNSNLPSNSIREIVIDNQNRKWISFSSANGLLQIDGDNWLIVDTSNSDIPSNFLNTINVDNLGNFWAGGWVDDFNYRLTKFDGTNWTVWDTLNSPIPESNVMSIVFDNMNNLWLLCMDPYHAYDENQIVELTQDSSWKFHSSFYDYVGSRQLMLDNNILWTAGSNGLYKYEEDSLSYFSGYSGQYPTDIKRDLTGNIWTATGEAGWGQLNKYDGNSFTSYPVVNAISIEVDSFNNIWTGTQDLGLGYSELIKFDGINWTYFNPLNSELPQTLTIQDLTFDNFGNLWIATEYEGIVVFNENGVVVPVELISFLSSITNNNATLIWEKKNTRRKKWGMGEHWFC
jgi:ligand-binding sensor domain-containing protein